MNELPPAKPIVFIIDDDASLRAACESAGNACANEMALVGMERDLAPADLKAVRTGIGAALRTVHSDVLREEFPDRMAGLLRQLDQQRAADSS